MPIIRLEMAENHLMYCLMLSYKFIAKNLRLRQESNLQSLGCRPTELITELPRP